MEKSLWRAVYQEYESEPLPSRSSAGRFHDELTAQTTTYLAARETAWLEVTHRWNADPTVYRWVEVHTALRRVADLTDAAVQERLGVTAAELRGDDYAITRRVAKALRADGYEGIWTYSRANQPNGRQLVVFLDLLLPGSEVRVGSTSQLTQQKG